MSSANGIARSLTRRITIKKPDFENGPLSPNGIGRSFSMRMKPAKPSFDRSKISLPVELLSTTNDLVFEAPDIRPARAQTQHSPAAPSPIEPSSRSFSSSSSVHTADSLPPLSSTASFESLPFAHSTPATPCHDHEIDALAVRLADLPEVGEEAQTGFAIPPAVPKRAPSHTKRTHQAVHRQRSMSRVRAPSTSAPTPPASLHRSASDINLSESRQSPQPSKAKPTTPHFVRSSIDMFSAKTVLAGIEAPHPFGAELAQVTELAEEFGGGGEADADTPAPLARRRGSREAPAKSSGAAANPAALRSPSRVRGRKPSSSVPATVWDEESAYLASHGLLRFGAEDYLIEIGSAPYIEEGGWL